MSYCRTTLVEFNSEKDADEKLTLITQKMLLPNFRKLKYYSLPELDLLQLW